jgi:SAM-dependent methyltransferase
VSHLLHSLKRRLPAPLRWELRRARHFGTARFCPVCGSHVRRFVPAGNIRRENVECPVCGSRERHRLGWLFLERRTNLQDGTPKRLLHIAPEFSLERRFRQIQGLDYLSADLENPAMVRMDITQIQYPDSSFDAIYCSHVLEHIPNDHAALREFCRVLKPGGWTVLLVPVLGVHTVEEVIPDDAERLQRYLGVDHVRAYGLDLVERMREAGFQAEAVQARDLISPAQMTTFGFLDEPVFYGVKPG